jgi:hypothetical protein
MRIDLRFSDADIASTVRAHEVLDRALRKTGKARLEYLDPPEGRAARVLEQATDGYHQLGLTRMGTAPRQSVVDPDCRVHGLANLFIASCSVFPTSGQGIRRCSRPRSPFVWQAISLRRCANSRLREPRARSSGDAPS